MKYYQPEETLNYDSQHEVLYTFQFEEATAQLFTTMSGNVAGGSVMETDFDCGFTVPADHELTKKHVVFYDDEDEDLPYREVGCIKFYYPDGETVELELEDCSNFLVGIQIVGYKEKGDN
jgi:hypothetical protein